MRCKLYFDEVAPAALQLCHAMPCGNRSAFPAGSTSRDCPPEEAGVKGDGRDEGRKCQPNTLSGSCILAQLIITFLSFSVHLQAIIIRAV